MNDAIVCEKCNYDLFMVCPDGLTVCNHCGEFSTVPNVSSAIDDETRKMALLIREAVNKGIFQGAMHRDAISILSRLTIFHGGENDSSR